MLDLPLDHLYRPSAEDADAPWLLVLLHGVGSNAQDLFSLAPYVPPAFHVLSLQAPYPMGPQAYAWFQFDVLDDGTRRIDAAQEARSRQLLALTVAQASAQLGVPARRVLVGGFSQGGIMSLSLLLTEPGLLHGIAVWHGRLLPEVLPQAVAHEALGGRVAWVSYGTLDQVIVPSSAHRIRDHLAATPVALQYREYPCDHSIHREELAQCMTWLQAQVDAQEA